MTTPHARTNSGQRIVGQLCLCWVSTGGWGEALVFVVAAVYQVIRCRSLSPSLPRSHRLILIVWQQFGSGTRLPENVCLLGDNDGTIMAAFPDMCTSQGRAQEIVRLDCLYVAALSVVGGRRYVMWRRSRGLFKSEIKATWGCNFKFC